MSCNSDSQSAGRRSRREFLVTATTAAVALAAAPSRVFAREANARRWPIAGFSKPFQKLGLEAMADTVAQIGWDGIECPVRPKGQIEPERVADELPRLVDALKRRGKEVLLLATGITSVKQPHTEKVLRTAAALGIKRYRLGERRYDLQQPIAGQLANVRAELRELAALNRELGLQAGWQNHSGLRYMGGPVWDMWTALQEIDPRDLGVCFDIGHATVEGGTVWPVNARLLQDRFTAVFVKDFIWQKTAKDWQPRWVMLGDGMISPDFFTWLKTTPFAGPIVQHHEYDHGEGAPMIAKMKKDLQVLREWLA